MAQLTKVDKQKLAKALYLSGRTNQDICEVVSMSTRTLNNYIEEGKWDMLRAAHFVTPDEVGKRLLKAIANLVDQSIESEEYFQLGDDVSKLTSSLEKLQKRNPLIDAIETFKKFITYLVTREKRDPTLSIEEVQRINTLQDDFIKELL